jgi:hypothetical protein
VIVIKHGKKPTYNQRKLLTKWKLKAEDWLVVKDTPEFMQLVHRFSDKTTRTIPKQTKENY